MPSSTAGKTNTKSRKGCAECKRKRVKCDEAKPVCSRCIGGGCPERCSYELKLSWTQGRPFKKRRDRNATPWSSRDGSATARTSAAPDERPVQGAARSEVLQSSASSSSQDCPDEGSSSERLIAAEAGSSISSTPLRMTGHVVENSGSSYVELDSSAVRHSGSAVVPESVPVEEEEDVEELERMQVPVPSLVPVRRASTSMIPPTISTYSLLFPSESPNARFFLHHYSVHASVSLFPLVPPSSRDSFLAIAAANPHLLSSLLAISCDHYSRVRGGQVTPDVKNRSLFFSRKAITGLREAMKDPLKAKEFSTISTALALCTNDIMSGNVGAWKTHLRGAEQLLSLAVGRRDSTVVTDPSKVFLIKWFAALDLFAGISSLEKSLVPDGRYWSISSSNDGSEQYVDDFVGFSLELMPILSRIGRMARLQQRRKALGRSLGSDYAEMAEDLDSLLSDNVQHTEQQLNSLFSRVSLPSTLAMSPTLAVDIQYSHQMFVYGALLHLYRRVQELPRHHPKPEHAMSKIIEILGKLRPESPATVVQLWPIFSAGCEAADPARRKFLLERMKAMKQHGMGNVDKALEAMQAYWHSDTDERWDVFLGRHGVDLVLF